MSALDERAIAEAQAAPQVTRAEAVKIAIAAADKHWTCCKQCYTEAAVEALANARFVKFKEE